jgi:hypothetical protein
MRDEAEHSAWKKTFTGLYNMSTIVNYEEAVDRMNAVCTDKLRQYAQEGKKVMLPRFLQCYAFDIIGEITVSRNEYCYSGVMC